MRHELKYRINYEDYLMIKSRLKHVMQADTHTGEKGIYQVHSLYFDTLSDRALRDKLDGVDHREKFRIRYYNEDTDYIRLEKKSKIHGLCEKRSVPLDKLQVIRIGKGDFSFLKNEGNPLLQELYAKMVIQVLRPRVIVDYEREPFIYSPGNVRVTFDSRIRTGLFHNTLFDGPLATAPTESDTIVMEIKYDAFLPEVIAKAVRVPGRPVTAYSKYAVCRMYG